MAEEKKVPTTFGPRTQDLKLGEPLRVKPKVLERVTTRELGGPGGGLKLTDNMFIARFADDEDLKVLKAVLEERMAKREKGPFYFRCPKCGWTAKLLRMIEEGSPCFHCNKQQRKDGGVLERLTKKGDIEAYEQSAREERARTVALGKVRAKAMFETWKGRVASGEFSK